MEGSEDESGRDDVTRRSHKRKSRSRNLNGNGRSSDESSRGVHGHREKNGGVEEGGDAEECDRGRD